MTLKARPGYWIRARTPITEPYPCFCADRSCSKHCWCRGRFDKGEPCPSYCCGRRPLDPPKARPNWRVAKAAALHTKLTEETP